MKKPIEARGVLMSAALSDFGWPHWLRVPFLPVVPTVETLRKDGVKDGYLSGLQTRFLSPWAEGSRTRCLPQPQGFDVLQLPLGFWIPLWTPSRRVSSDLQLPKGMRYFPFSSFFCSWKNSWQYNQGSGAPCNACTFFSPIFVEHAWGSGLSYCTAEPPGSKPAL